MKYFFVLSLTILCVFLCVQSTYGQTQLSDIDTSLRYKQKYYPNGVLTTPNHYIVLKGSEIVAQNMSYNEIRSDESIMQDSSQLRWLKNGTWMRYWDAHMNLCSSAKFTYYSLETYEHDTIYEKMYYFDKRHQLTQTFEGYPKINNLYFEGNATIYYSKTNVINKIELDLWNKDNRGYIHSTYFRKNQTIKQFIYLDDYVSKHYSFKTFKNGDCKSEHYWDKNHFVTFRKSRLLFRTKVIDYDMNPTTIFIYRNGKIAKVKSK